MINITTINEFSAAWAPLIWKASWQGGAALLLVLAVSLSVRKLPAHVRCWLWRLAFIKLLLIGLWVVPVELHVLQPVETVAVEPMTDVAPIEFSAVAEPVVISAHQPISVPTATPQLSRSSWLLVAWSLGVTLLLANLLRHWIQIRRMVRRLQAVTDKQILERFAESCRLMGVRRPPELRISNDTGSPCLIGIRRPVIVLPSIVLKTCSAEQQSAALIHELAHLKRRDLLWNWLPALAEAFFFFHPLVWLVKREWHFSQEIATDNLALSVSRVSVGQYAKSLVELVEKCPRSTICPHLALSVSESFSQLSRRIVAMKKFQTLTAFRRRTLGMVVLVIAVLGVVPWKLTIQEVTAETVVKHRNSKTITTSGDKPKRKKAPTRTIVIHVVDADGKPIEGAEVSKDLGYLLDGGSRFKREKKRYLTDAAGEVVVAQPMGINWISLALRASKNSFVPMEVKWDESEAHRFMVLRAPELRSRESMEIPLEITFPLERGVTIGGIVKDGRKPIKGVKVEVRDWTALTHWNRANRPARVYDYGAVYTNAQGEWSINNLPPKESLVFDQRVRDNYKRSNRSLPPKLELWVSHPDYFNDTEWGSLQRKNYVDSDNFHKGTVIIRMDADMHARRNEKN